MAAPAKYRAASRALVAPEIVRAADEAVVAKALAKQQVVAARRALRQAETLVRSCTRRARATDAAFLKAAQQARAARARAKASGPDRRGRRT